MSKPKRINRGKRQTAVARESLRQHAPTGKISQASGNGAPVSRRRQRCVTTRDWAGKLTYDSTEQLKSIVKTEPNSPKRRGAQVALARRALQMKVRVKSTCSFPTCDMCLLLDVDIFDALLFDLIHKLGKFSRAELMRIARSALSPVIREVASQNLSVCNNLVNPSFAPERKGRTHRQQGGASHVAKGLWGHSLRMRLK